MIKESVNQGVITKTLDWAYTKAVVGFTGVDSAYELGNDYMKHAGTLDEQVNSLIKWQVAKSGTSGFLGGVGGLIVMPVAMPANIASVLYIQIRMIAAIAYMGGYNLKDDKVKSMIYICMAGNGAKEIIKDFGIKAGEHFLQSFAKDLSMRAVTEVNQKVGQKLLTKFGEKGATSSFGKAVPLMGGFIGGAFDAVATRIVGKVAKKTFIDSNYN